MNREEYIRLRDINIGLLRGCSIALSMIKIGSAQGVCMKCNALVEMLSTDEQNEKTIGLLNQRKDFLELAPEVLKKGDEKSTNAMINKLGHFVKTATTSLKNERKERTKNLNSREFMEKQLITMDEEITALQNVLNSLKTAGKENSKEYRQKSEALMAKKTERNEVANKLQDRLSTEDTIEYLQKRILPFGTNLESSIKNIQGEQLRLYWMFGVYAGLSILIVVGIIVWEAYLIGWRWKPEYAENILMYIPFYLPIPLAGALLWAFIYQMNRCQKQLIFLANRLHAVRYTEGLLKAVCSLTNDVEKNEEKVSRIIDHIIDSNLRDIANTIEPLRTDEQNAGIDGLLDKLIDFTKAIKKE